MRRPDFFAVAGFVALGALLMLPFVSGERLPFPFHTADLAPWSATRGDGPFGEPRNENVSDKHAIIHPDQVLTRRQLGDSHMPLWNPHNFAGLPHQANPLTATVYPPNLVFSGVDLLESYAWLAALHVVLSGAFAYALLRSLRVGAGGAFLGGLAFALSGWMAVHVQHNYFVHALTWLPLALLSVEVLLQRRRRWALMTLALSIAMMFLAGFPQTAVLNCYLLLAWTVIGMIRVGVRDGAHCALSRGAVIGAFAALGLALAAVQLAPTAELAARATHRDLDVEALRSDSLEPITLVHLLAPDVFGNPQTSGLLEPEVFTAPARETRETLPANLLELIFLRAPGANATSNNYSERTFHIGVLPLILALACLFLRRDRVTWTLAATAVIAVLFATATRPVLDILHRLPGLNFGSPMRATQLAAFALPMLFGIAFHEISARTRVSTRLLTTLLVGGLVVIIPVAIVAMAVWIAPGKSAAWLAELMVERGIDVRLGAGDMKMEQKVAYVLAPVKELRSPITVALTLLLASWALLLLWARGTVRGAALFALALGITAVDLGWHFARFNLPVTRRGLYSTPAPGLNFLQGHLGDGRFARWGADSPSHFFSVNAPLVYGLNDLHGFRALAPARFLDFMRTVEPNPHTAGFPGLTSTDSLRSPQLGLARVRYVISQGPVADSPWPQVFPTESGPDPAGMFIYENPVVLPRAFLVHRVNVLPPADTLRELSALPTLGVENPTNVFATEVWLEELRVGMRSRYPEPAEPVDVVVTGDSPGKIDVTLGGDAAGILVVSEQWDEGWTAYSVAEDGRRSEIAVLPADHTFMGIPVDGRVRKIELRYQPDAFKWGGLITGLALVFLLVMPLLKGLTAKDDDAEEGDVLPSTTEAI